MDDPTAIFHLQPLTALAVLLPYRVLPLTALFSRGQSHLALIHDGSRQLDLQRRYCRAQGSTWTRSILFATAKSQWLSPTVGWLSGDAVVVLPGLFKPHAGSQAQHGLPRETGAFHSAAYKIGSLRIESLPPPSSGTGRKHNMLPEIMPSMWHTPGGVKRRSRRPYRQPCAFCVGRGGKITQAICCGCCRALYF